MLSEELNAFHDRLLVRMNVKYIQDPANRVKMYNLHMAYQNGSMSNLARTTITLDEVIGLNMFASKFVNVPNTVLTKLVSVINKLNASGIIVSDRRQNKCIDYMKANAAMNGRDTVNNSDLHCLTSILWEKEMDIDVIEKELQAYADPYSLKVKEIRAKFNEIIADIDNTDQANRTAKVVGAKGHITKLCTEAKKNAEKAVKEGYDGSDLTNLNIEMRDYANKLMKMDMGLDEDVF